VALPAEAYRLTKISSKAYEHPADRAATAALGSIPMLDLVVRKLIELGYERALRQTYLGSSVRLGPDQLPRIWEADHHPQQRDRVAARRARHRGRPRA
jgi:hypothetical protein